MEVLVKRFEHLSEMISSFKLFSELITHIVVWCMDYVNIFTCKLFLLLMITVRVKMLSVLEVD